MTQAKGLKRAEKQGNHNPEEAKRERRQRRQKAKKKEAKMHRDKGKEANEPGKATSASQCNISCCIF